MESYPHLLVAMTHCLYLEHSDKQTTAPSTLVVELVSQIQVSNASKEVLKSHLSWMEADCFVKDHLLIVVEVRPGSELLDRTPLVKCNNPRSFWVRSFEDGELVELDPYSSSQPAKYYN